MSIIKSHDITLYGGNDDYKIILRPLTDEHLPYLYKWNADPEVLYWTESGVDSTNLSYDHDTVHHIYGGVSQNAFCFLIEVNGVPIGECWLQKMNLPDVIDIYPYGTDVRRIDMCIGEKSYWNKGIGTQFIGMMIDFAFNGEHVDILHCLCEDYNVRSRRMWEKHGFTLVREDKETYNPQVKSPIDNYQYHYRLTRHEYIQRLRYRPEAKEIFILPIMILQPSQLYISEGKLQNVREWFNSSDISTFDPIPIKYFMGRKLMTDGHTRTVAAYLAGWKDVPIYIDTDEFNMESYLIDIKWCEEDGIHSPADLGKRIVSHRDYEELWRRRCIEM